MFAFLRSFGFVWGVTIPSLIFIAGFDHHASRPIADASVRRALTDGKAYESVGSQYFKTLPDNIAFGNTALVAVGVEKHIPLRVELETEYGLEVKKLNSNEECDPRIDEKSERS
jgi:hypothetical protein